MFPEKRRRVRSEGCVAPPTQLFSLLRGWVGGANPAYVGEAARTCGSSGCVSDLSDAWRRSSPIAAGVAPGHASSMRTYLRNRTVGGTYFFTVNLAQRRGNRLLLEHVGALRAAFRRTCLRSEEHTSDLQYLMRISYAVFCLKKKNKIYYTITQRIY